ncbi:hypothetical protein ACFFLM_26095 [Deinococcus oregonensis]|uniref:Uncharacterized protein n=1 Tax=Deinococcus oregonensis TaxID=1805970 RepID=A0ABV6B6M4_9DEIO
MPSLTPDEQIWNRTFVRQVTEPMQAVVRVIRQQGVQSRVHQHGPLMASLSLSSAVSKTVCADFLIQKHPDGWLISRVRHVPLPDTARTRLEGAQEVHAELPTATWLLAALRDFVRQEQASGLLNPRGKPGLARASRRAQEHEPPEAAGSSTHA